MTNQSVFVTDDDQTYVETIQEILIGAGYQQVTWHVGNGAFHKIRRTQPKLVLLDISFTDPGRSWITLETLRLHPATRHIPIILYSTDMKLLNEKADLLRELGCQTLEKPFELETLLDKITAVIGPPAPTP